MSQQQRQADHDKEASRACLTSADESDRAFSAANDADDAVCAAMWIEPTTDRRITQLRRALELATTARMAAGRAAESAAEAEMLLIQAIVGDDDAVNLHDVAAVAAARAAAHARAAELKADRERRNAAQ